MEKNRLEYFDLAKGIGIFLVILGHITYISQPLRIWIFSFHMPLFFIISGMLIYYKREDSLNSRELIKKKAKSLLIPYFFFSILTIFADICLLLLFQVGNWERIWQNCFYTCSFYGISTLWFLPALFLGENLFLFILKKFSKSQAIVFMLFLSIVCYFCIINMQYLYVLPINPLLLYYIQHPLFVAFKGVIAMSYIAIGYFSYPFFSRSYTTPFKSIGIGIIFLFCSIFLCPLNGNADLGHLLLNNLPLYYIFGILGSFSIILLCKNVKVKNGLRTSNPIFMLFQSVNFFGSHTIILMATHLNLYVSYISIRIILFFSPSMESHPSLMSFWIFILIMAFETVLIFFFEQMQILYKTNKRH